MERGLQEWGGIKQKGLNISIQPPSAFTFYYLLLHAINAPTANLDEKLLALNRY